MRADKVFTILDTETDSDVVNKEHLDLVGIISPTTVTVAVHGCDTESGTFGACEDTNGTAISLTLTANQPRALKMNDYPWQYLQLVASAAVSADLVIRPKFRDLAG